MKIICFYKQKIKTAQKITWDLGDWLTIYYNIKIQSQKYIRK